MQKILLAECDKLIKKSRHTRLVLVEMISCPHWTNKHPLAGLLHGRLISSYSKFSHLASLHHECKTEVIGRSVLHVWFFFYSCMQMLIVHGLITRIDILTVISARLIVEVLRQGTSETFFCMFRYF